MGRAPGGMEHVAVGDAAHVVTSAELGDVVALSDRLAVDYLERNALLPLRREGDRVVVATWRAAVDVQALDDLRLLFGAALDLVRGQEPEVRAAVQRAYSAEAVTARELIAGIGESAASPTATDAEAALDDPRAQAGEAFVIRLVRRLLLEALDARASDVHIEGYADALRVRYRIDGVLQEAPSPPARLMPAVINRLKILAELDIAERRSPQDGRIRLTLRDRAVDVRVATLPTLHGESVVLRLLDADRGRAALAELGMADDTRADFVRAIGRPHGIVLATGPTGSGKTTTLYAAVDHIRTGREKILTVEDPVEYELVGVPQVPVHERSGVTFATALRALLRQDPDVMLIGEIRDAETAEIATQAALTGHLVLSTLHTNDAAGALTRLLDLGVAPFLVTSTVEAVLAQRLVRTVCAGCRARIPVDAWPAELGEPAPPVVWRGAGCAACRGTGYRGRTGIYELLVMHADLRAEVLQRRGDDTLRRVAAARGMRTLRDDGLRLVHAGVTTPEEVLRVTHG